MKELHITSVFDLKNRLDNEDFLNQLDNGILKMIWTYTDNKKNSIYAHNGFLYFKIYDNDKNKLTYKDITKEEVTTFLISKLRRKKLNKIFNGV